MEPFYSLLTCVYLFASQYLYESKHPSLEVYVYMFFKGLAYAALSTQVKRSSPLCVTTVLVARRHTVNEETNVAVNDLQFERSNPQLKRNGGAQDFTTPMLCMVFKSTEISEDVLICWKSIKLRCRTTANKNGD